MLVKLTIRPRDSKNRPFSCENLHCGKPLKGRFKILSRGGPEYHICMSCYFHALRKSKGNLEKYVPDLPAYNYVEAYNPGPTNLLERVKEQIKQETPPPEPIDFDPAIMAAVIGASMIPRRMVSKELPNLHRINDGGSNDQK